MVRLAWIVGAIASAPAWSQSTELVRELGSEDWSTRTRAESGLAELGRPALEGLRRAMESPDPEVAWRARRIVEGIEWPGLAAVRRAGHGFEVEHPAYPELRFFVGGSRGPIVIEKFGAGALVVDDRTRQILIERYPDRESSFLPCLGVERPRFT